MTPSTIEELRAILDGLEGVTPGPWWSDEDGGDEFKAYAVFGPHERYGKPSSICDTHNAGEVVLEQEDGKPWDEQGRKNLAHIARLDPETVRSIVSELLARRSDGLGTVSVNALVWDGDEAVTPFGAYRLYQTDDGYGLSFNYDELVHVGFNAVGTFTSPRDKAATYAQPHYSAAVKSCLTSIGVEAAMKAALRVFGEWAIDVSTLGELGDLETRMAAIGVTLEQVGAWTSGSGVQS